MTSTAVFKKSDPIGYYDQYLLEGVLPDGRNVKDYRPICINPGTNWRQQRAVVMEHGKVIISVTGKLVLQRDNDSPTLKFKFKSEDPKRLDSLKSVAETLKYLEKNNIFFDKKEFKAEEEAFRWQLKITITVFNADGHIMDAVLIGLNALFAQIEIPQVGYNWLKTLERNEQTIDVKRVEISDKTRKLNIAETPVYSSFALYQSKNNPDTFIEPLLIVDPPSELIELSSSILEFIHISNGRIVFSNIYGKVVITPEIFEDAAQRSAEHYLHVSESLKKYAKEHSKN
uniref:Ribosomal RNA-processing protein 43 n=1 Tax=Panagrolaimus sp. PS1159 TaxID=55785 RepID=A0AC35GW18_9BILA